MLVFQLSRFAIGKSRVLTEQAPVHRTPSARAVSAHEMLCTTEQEFRPPYRPTDLEYVAWSQSVVDCAGLREHWQQDRRYVRPYPGVRVWQRRSLPGEPPSVPHSGRRGNSYLLMGSLLFQRRVCYGRSRETSIEQIFKPPQEYSLTRKGRSGHLPVCCAGAGRRQRGRATWPVLPIPRVSR
jgi:hypothetical protein